MRIAALVTGNPAQSVGRNKNVDYSTRGLSVPDATAGGMVYVSTGYKVAREERNLADFRSRPLLSIVRPLTTAVRALPSVIVLRKRRSLALYASVFSFFLDWIRPV
jgi:hypothetical protein